MALHVDAILVPSDYEPLTNFAPFFNIVAVDVARTRSLERIIAPQMKKFAVDEDALVAKTISQNFYTKRNAQQLSTFVIIV